MRSYSIFYRKNPALDECPSCHSNGTVYRSHSRNRREKLIKKITFLKTYRCKKCGWRGFRSTATVSIKSVQTLLFYIGIVVIVVLIVRFILQRITS